MRRVVITGMGVVTAAGQNVGEFTTALKTGRSGIQAVATTESTVASGALLADFDIDEVLARFSDLPAWLYRRARGAVRRAPLSMQVSVCSALEAWQHAALSDASLETDRSSLVVAGQNLNRSYSYANQQQYQTALEYLPPRYGVHFLDTDQVGTISELLQIHGEGTTVGGASASGNVGIMQGARLIQWGVADVCVVLGAMMDLSPLEIQAFRALGALGGKTITDATKACRPFDMAREGFLYGQGSGCLILESTESAQRRGISPLAEVAGYGMNLDGNRLTDPNPLGEAKAMQQALRGAGIAPDKVEYINTHGTSSVMGDEAEIAAINAVFGDVAPPPWLNSTKSLTGHCLTAAGVIEAIATVIQMTEGFLHPNLNLDNPLDMACRFVGTQQQPATIANALSNSFGFGGINSAILLRKP